MFRAALLICAMLFAGGAALAQPMGALARLVAENSALSVSDGAVDLSLGLTQAVPFRVFTLAGPERLVIDFREVDFADLETALAPRGPVRAIAAGRATEPGWSRLVLTLDGPWLPETAAMRTDEATGAAQVTVRLAPATAEAFAARARVLPAPAASPPAATPTRPRLSVVLDPGHGGVDPGAVRGEITEAALVLSYARELRAALRRTGLVDVVLTRDADIFVPLPTRVTLARAAGADLLLSIHADALAQGRAQGATVYTLSETASDAAAAALAEQHDRADILNGVDLRGTDDVVAGVLMDLARTQTAPRSAALADALVRDLAEAEIRLHARPRGEAGFTVLRAADIPSVLLEIGFMSDPRDLANIQDPAWRARMQGALVSAILDWAEAEAARTARLRQ